MNNVRWFLLLVIFCIGVIIFIKVNEKFSHISFLQYDRLSRLTPEEFDQLISPNERRALIQQIVKDSLKEILASNLTKMTNFNAQNRKDKTYHVDLVKKIFQNESFSNESLIERNSKLKPFQIQMTFDERAMVYRLLELFDQTMKKNNFTYFLYGGTLLGSFRHHDLIPWDDDVDIIIPVKQREKIKEIFQKFSPDYTYIVTSGHDKFFHKSAKPTKFSWSWPYLDISYYNENNTHITDIIKTYGNWYSYPKEIVFPLHNRPILNYSLPSPKDTFAFLVWTYGYGSPCHTGGYSHMVEGYGPSGEIDCKTLSEKFPFVEHLPHENGVREILKYKEIEITDIVIPEPKYAVSETFILSLKPGFSMPKEIIPPKK